MYSFDISYIIALVWPPKKLRNRLVARGRKRLCTTALGNFHSVTNAKITPTFKQGDRTNVTNYRPISVLPYFVKLMEKAVSKRLTDYVYIILPFCPGPGW